MIISCVAVNTTSYSRNIIQWEKELSRKKTQEHIRELEWERQVEQKRAIEHLQEKEWEEKREQERIREEQWNLSQEQRERLGLYWDQPSAGRCIAYGVRDYRAQLLNAAPYNYNWLQPCQDMPISIHGSLHTASRCERIGGVRVVRLNSKCPH